MLLGAGNQTVSPLVRFSRAGVGATIRLSLILDSLGTPSPMIQTLIPSYSTSSRTAAFYNILRGDIGIGRAVIWNPQARPNKEKR